MISHLVTRLKPGVGEAARARRGESGPLQYHDRKTGKDYVFLTTHFHLSAKTIADIYKSRWQVELFFQWIKQNLKVKSFVGTSRNAVMTQVTRSIATVDVKSAEGLSDDTGAALLSAAVVTTKYTIHVPLIIVSILPSIYRN